MRFLIYLNTEKGNEVSHDKNSKMVYSALLISFPKITPENAKGQTCWICILTISELNFTLS